MKSTDERLRKFEDPVNVVNYSDGGGSRNFRGRNNNRRYNGSRRYNGRSRGGFRGFGRNRQQQQQQQVIKCYKCNGDNHYAWGCTMSEN